MLTIRRPSFLVLLSAFAALAVLSACETSPMANPGAPDTRMTASGPKAAELDALSHGGGNGNNGHNDGTNDNDDQDNAGNGNHGNNSQAGCPAVGTNVEIEGTIAARGATSIFVRQQGRKDFVCQVNRATRIRKGDKNYSLAQLQNGWRVHVKGDTLANSISNISCTVTAREIKVQNPQPSGTN